MAFWMQPFDGSKGARKDARRKVRNVLGTSREDAPGVMQAITAAQALNDLMQQATAGQFRVVIERVQGGARGTISFSEARDLARAERPESPGYVGDAEGAHR